MASRPHITSGAGDTSRGYLIVKLPLSPKFADVWSLLSGVQPTLDVSIPDAVDKGAWMTDGLKALFPSGNFGSSWHSHHSGRTHEGADTGSIWNNQCQERRQTLPGLGDTLSNSKYR